MKDLLLIPGHSKEIESLFPFDTHIVSHFIRYAKNGELFLNSKMSGEPAIIGADVWPTHNSERAMMYFVNRCPTWPEMVALKNIFWKSNEICIQVHPNRENYVNRLPYALHLWKPKDPNSNQVLHNIVAPLVERTLAMLEHQARCSEPGTFLRSTIDGKNFVAIFSGTDWLKWEQVCGIKKHCFGEDVTALQFNISPHIDLNFYHILLLWNATDFDIVLPLKEYV